MNLKIFCILFFAIFCSMLGAGLVVPLLPAYAYDLGASGIYIGFIFAAFSLSRTLGLPLFGRLSDRQGRKPFISFGLLGYFLASIAYIYSENLTALIIVRTLQGIAAAMILPVARAYAGEITPTGKEGRIMGVFNISLYGGLSLGPVIGGVVKDAFGLKASFLTMGFVCLVGFLACLAFLPPRKEERLYKGSKRPVRYGAILTDRHVMGLFLFCLAYTMCTGTIWSFGPLLAHIEFSMTSFEVGLIISLSVLVSALFMAPMGVVADSVNKQALVMSGGLITACAMIAFFIGRESWMLITSSVFVGLGGGIAMPSVMAMGVVVGREKDSMGSVMAILTMGHSLAMVIGPILGGIIVDLLYLRLVFAGGVIIMLLGTVSSLALTSNYQRLEKSQGKPNEGS